MVECLHRGFNHPNGYQCDSKNIKIDWLMQIGMLGTYWSVKIVNMARLCLFQLIMATAFLQILRIAHLTGFTGLKLNSRTLMKQLSTSKALDVEQDIALLKFHGWDMPPECARTLCISTMLLKKGAERGLTPFAIGSLMCRETVKKESVIEQIVQEAQDAILPGSGEATFLEAVSLIMDRHLDNLSP
ncbi:hypothetical protein OIU76_022862 [Salix suchowensis]|nr:hypothetical protein OIU76_022862 [Salix suchowensis]